MLIEIKDLYKIYNEGKESEVRALDGVTLHIDRGEFVAIVGQSAAGATGSGCAPGNRTPRAAAPACWPSR